MLGLYTGLQSSLLFVAGFAFLLSVLPNRRLPARVLVVAIALYFNHDYVVWRRVATLGGPDPSLQAAWFWTIYALECVAVVSVSWHLLVLVRRSDRTAQADAAEARLRAAGKVPSVDVFVVTVNEGRELLERTIRAASHLDYPRYEVWVLDDGARPWLRTLCEQYGARYHARSSRSGFKAGNQNSALPVSHGELILCLDADFVVEPGLLWRTVGLFEDPSVGLVQTPQHFVNADPIQVNLGGQDAWPEEQRVFTDVMLPSRDVWDNAFCYGTNFVIRRRCLEEIGGFPEETICEDLYTTYLLKARGYVTRYLNEPLARGLAAESLAEFVKQRSRWCLGTLQCLYLPGGPLRAKGLSLLDRIFFLDPILFYVSYLYVFSMLLAPAVFWWTGVPPFNSELGHFLSVLAPRMGVSMLALYWLTDRKVVPVVSELGRIVGISFFVAAILNGLLRPFGHAFEVTLKGHRREREETQWRILAPHVGLAFVIVGGLAFNVLLPRFTLVEWNQNVGLGIALSVYVLWMLFFAALACVEQPHPEGDPVPGATEGSVGRAALALARRCLR